VWKTKHKPLGPPPLCIATTCLFAVARKDQEGSEGWRVRQSEVEQKEEMGGLRDLTRLTISRKQLNPNTLFFYPFHSSFPLASMPKPRIAPKAHADHDAEASSCSHHRLSSSRAPRSSG